MPSLSLSLSLLHACVVDVHFLWRLLNPYRLNKDVSFTEGGLLGGTLYRHVVTPSTPCFSRTQSSRCPLGSLRTSPGLQRGSWPTRGVCYISTQTFLRSFFNVSLAMMCYFPSVAKVVDFREKKHHVERGTRRQRRTRSEPVLLSASFNHTPSVWRDRKQSHRKNKKISSWPFTED